MTKTCLSKHQLDAIEKLQTGSILCGRVGSGKSRTAIGYFLLKVCTRFENPRSPIPLYIITTAKKRDSHEWEEECAIFSMESRKIVVDSWNNLHKYEDVEKAFFIFDEQRVVGSGSWVKSFLKITKSNQWILLSATPGDTWMDYIPVFIANRFYKNRTEFVRRHVVFSRFAKYPKVDHYVNISRLELFRSLILVDMDYEHKIEKTVTDMRVPYDSQLYLKALKNRWDVYDDKPIQDAGSLCYILRRVTNSHPDRLQVVKKLLNRHKKVIIFYNFDYELGLLKDFLCKEEVIYRQWNGHKHEELPDTDRWAYLVQYTAGSEGWNCVETNAIIFYSLNYSYKVMTQAAGRIDRMNTPFPILYYYRIVSNSSIDRSISQALSEKKTFNENAFLAKKTHHIMKRR